MTPNNKTSRTEQADGRMQWIRNLDDAASATGTTALDVVLGSEVRIMGVLDYADGALRCAPYTIERDSSGLYKYLLRIKLATGDTDDYVDAPRTRKGYLFPPGMPGELAALFSLFFQARFYILSTTHGEMSATSIPVMTEHSTFRSRYGPQLDPIVFSNEPREFHELLPTFLDGLRQLPAPHHEYIQAAHHYSQALREIGIDEEMVFIRLVSSVEVAAANHPPSLELFSDLSFDDLVRTEKLSEEQTQELRTAFDTRKAQERFISFLVSRAGDFLPRDPSLPGHTIITLDKLPDVARAIYKARSAYLHDGRTMYLSQFVPAYPGWDTDPSQGMRWQDRIFAAREKLPNANFFHALVRHCLLKYFDEEGAGTRGESTEAS